MIALSRHTLSNGLRIVHVHNDKSRFVTLSVLYDVGSKDEQPHRTGLAHLLEHLMFGGSANVTNFDEQIQRAGGYDNAFTSADETMFYETLPAQNVETAFWLESDRMKSLLFSEQSLEVQRKVVIEEFKQTRLNRPYADLYPLVNEVLFAGTAYEWPVIGKEICHIQNATMQDVKDFFFSHYAPNNAILTVVGNVSFERTVSLAEKWFGDIERREIVPFVWNVPSLFAQSCHQNRRNENVQGDIISLNYPVNGRCDHRTTLVDVVLSNILSSGDTSRLTKIYRQNRSFSGLYCTASFSRYGGVLNVCGIMLPEENYNTAKSVIDEEIERLFSEPMTPKELQRVINFWISNESKENIDNSKLAFKLAKSELLGRAEDYLQEIEQIKSITIDMVMERARKVFLETPCFSLYYGPNA